MIIRLFSVALLASAILAGAQSQEGKPLRVAIAGLNHGHVSGFFSSARRRAADIAIVAVWDPDPALLQKYGDANHLASDALYTDLDKMLDNVKPEAVATFTDTYSHLRVVETCAPRHIPVMMEKPLAVDRKQARAIQQASAKYNTPVFVNYETTWYRSHGEIWNLLHEQKAGGEIRRMVAMDGHQGPREINVQPEFFAWLNDPVRNGAGALFDFGCYGANLMTWIMDNQRPLKVTALTQTNKPEVYTRVDDEATVLLEYPKAQGVIQASWNWPVGRKDFEVYGATGYAITVGPDKVRLRHEHDSDEQLTTAASLSGVQSNSLNYLAAVLRGQLEPKGDLSALDTNVVVMQILDAARESARTGRSVRLTKLDE